jgi:hypothetical protein
VGCFELIWIRDRAWRLRQKYGKRVSGVGPVFLPSSPGFPEWGYISHPGTLRFVQSRQPTGEIAGVPITVGEARGFKCNSEFPVNFPAFFAGKGLHAS